MHHLSSVLGRQVPATHTRCGPGQPALVEGIPADCRGVAKMTSEDPLQLDAVCESVLWSKTEMEGRGLGILLAAEELQDQC